MCRWFLPHTCDRMSATCAAHGLRLLHTRRVPARCTRPLGWMPCGPVELAFLAEPCAIQNRPEQLTMAKVLTTIPGADSREVSPAFCVGGRITAPLLAVALHAGHEMRAEAERRIALDEQQRLREEDPFTEVWTPRALRRTATDVVNPGFTSSCGTTPCRASSTRCASR